MTNLTIIWDRGAKESLQSQLVKALKKYISNDLLANNILVKDLLANDLRLPSSRAFARDLGVSRIVILGAYEQLIAEGYLVSRAGSGTYINKEILPTTRKARPAAQTYRGPNWLPVEPRPAKEDKNEERPEERPEERREEKYDVEFSLGRPSADKFDEAAWKRAWRRALSLPFHNRSTIPEGIASLRDSIAGMLARNRGIRCSPEDIIITTGAVDIITLIARITAPFKPVSYLENPGFQAAWEIFQRYNHDVRPLNIDQEGLRVTDLPTTENRAKLLFCTPSHQFPLGTRLSLPRRIALMDWARRHDAIILEDDYDSEFRYDVAPLPSLKAQDETGHVIYFSSLSKSLSPAIRLGYMIAPETIRAAVCREIEKNHMQPPWLLQQAMSHFIQAGELDKHIRRMRRHYTILNKEMREGLSHLPSEIKVHGLEAGLHCFLEIPPRMDLQKLQNSLQIQGIRIDDIRRCYYAPSPWYGFALGYGHLTPESLKYSVKKLIKILTEHLSKTAL